MTKEEFLKRLEKNLRILPKEERDKELLAYRTLEELNLDPLEEANKIYEKRGLYQEIKKPTKLVDAISLIIKELETKNKEKTKNILLFFLKTLLIIIIIKVPFIYVRDMTSNLFTEIFKEDSAYALLYFGTEIIYAITGILIATKRIKRKAIEIEYKTSANKH